MANPLNIINEIQAPDLTNENLSASLKEVFEKINDNFKKIISAPIYRGQKGESVRIEPVTLFDEGTNTFTEEGQKLVKVIFDIDFTEWEGGKADLDGRLDGDPRYKKIGGVCASDYFKSNTSILMFQLDDVAETNLTPAQIYAFQDKRVGYLTGQDTNFVDASCFISFEWDENTYNYVKINEFPTIQWSNSVNDYVWSINGQQTNIIAKGLKGMDASFTLPLFMVEDNEEYWEVTGVKQGDTNVEITDESFPWDDYNVGMGCVAYITVDGTITGLDISSIRQIDREHTTLSINKSGANIEAKQLVTMLGEIRPYRDNVVLDSNPPALFIPAGVTGLGDHVHAAWRNTGTGIDCKDLHIGYSKIVNNEIEPGEDRANLTLHGYNAIYFDRDNVYVENPLPDNPPIPNIKLNNGILEVSSGGVNPSDFILKPGELLLSSNNVTVKIPSIKLTNDDDPSNPGYINISPNKIEATVGEIILNGPKFYLKEATGGSSILQVARNNIILREEYIRINSTYRTDNTIEIGKKDFSNIQISGKNINIIGPTSFGNDVTFNGETTFKKAATFEEETIIGGQDFSKIINANGWYNDSPTSTGIAIYPVEKDNNNSVKIENVWFNGWKWVYGNKDHKWYTEKEMVGKNPNNYFCWAWFQPYYVQMGKTAKIWGFFTPFHDDCTDYIIDLSKIVNFSSKYKQPASNSGTLGFIIGTCQTNDADNSSPVIWRNSIGTCPSGTYPTDDTISKLHGWVYLYSAEPLIMFVTPKVGRTYYFEITYFVD